MRFLLFFISISLPFAIHSEPLSEVEQAKLDQRKVDFLSAFEKKPIDTATIINVVPPKIFEHIASTGKTSVDAMKAGMKRGMVKLFDNVTFANLSIKTKGIDVTKVMFDGQPYLYGFAPMSVTVIMYGQSFSQESFTLVLNDGGEWYLVRTDEAQQILFLRQAYPFFENVEFKGPTFK